MTTNESVESILHAPWWPELLSLAARSSVDALSRQFGVEAATVEAALQQVGLGEGGSDHPADSLRVLAGTARDAEVAARLGLTPNEVKAYRLAEGIRRFRRPSANAGSVGPESSPAGPGRVLRRREGAIEEVRGAVAAVAPAHAPPHPTGSPLQAFQDRMGTVSDDVVAGLAGVNRAAVRSYRVKHGIPAYDGFRSRKRERRSVPAAPKAKRGRVSRVEPFLHLLGEVPDAEVATLAGVTKANVTAYRHRKGIQLNLRSAGPGPVVPAPAVPTSDPLPGPLRESTTAVAVTVIAVRRSEFVTTGTSLADAAARAESLLAARDDGPWEVVEVKWLGKALG